MRPQCCALLHNTQSPNSVLVLQHFYSSLNTVNNVFNDISLFDGLVCGVESNSSNPGLATSVVAVLLLHTDRTDSVVLQNLVNTDITMGLSQSAPKITAHDRAILECVGFHDLSTKR